MNENETTAGLFRCMGHPLRIRLLKWLIEFEDVLESASPVPTAIALELEESLTNISFHLNKMYSVGILNRSISGRYSFYSPNWPSINLMKGVFNESQ